MMRATSNPGENWENGISVPHKGTPHPTRHAAVAGTAKPSQKKPDKPLKFPDASDQEEEEKVNAPVVEKGTGRKYSVEVPPNQQQQQQEQAPPHGVAKSCCLCLKDAVIDTMTLWRSFGEEFQEMFYYIIFLAIFCVVIFSPRSAQPYRMKVSMEDYFLNTGDKYFSSISSIPDTYTWLKSGLIPNVYPESDFYTGYLFNTTIPTLNMSANATLEVEDSQTLTNLKALLKGSNRRIGKVQLRLIRMNDDSCGIMRVFSSHLTTCYDEYSTRLQAKDEWKGYTWKSAEVTGHSNWYSTNTKIKYSGSGYTIDLPNTRAQAMKITKNLYESRFLDFSARALFVDFSVYNANVDLVGVVRLVVEFTASGAVFPTEDIKVVALLSPYRVLTNDGVTKFEAAIFILELVFFCIVFWYIWEEVKEYRDQGWKAYMSFWWNWVEIFNLSIFVIVLCLKMAWIGYLFAQKEKFAITDSYVNLIDLAWFVKQVDNLYAFNAVITFFKLFKFLRHNPNMAQLTKTIGKASAEMIAVMAIMCVVAAGYGTAFHLAFGRNNADFLDFPESCFSMLRFMLGDFDLENLLNSENSDLGIFLFLSFVVIMGFVMLSIFVAVVSSAYDRVRIEVLNQADPLTKDIIRVVRAPADAIWTLYSSIKYIFTGIDLRHPRDRDDLNLKFKEEEDTVLLEKERELAEQQKNHQFYTDVRDRLEILEQIQNHLKESFQGIAQRLETVHTMQSHESFQMDGSEESKGHSPSNK